MHRDRSATMVKFGTDVQDMEFLCGQIADEEDLTTTFDVYTLKRRQEIRTNLAKLAEISRAIRRLHKRLLDASPS